MFVVSVPCFSHLPLVFDSFWDGDLVTSKKNSNMFTIWEKKNFTFPDVDNSNSRGGDVKLSNKLIKNNIYLLEASSSVVAVASGRLTPPTTTPRSPSINLRLYTILSF
ncbi:hypothetical protein AAZX31_02G204500 [Glycine max]